jgi:hydrogenase-4 component F
MFLGCLLFVFFGITRVVFAIVDGRPHARNIETSRRYAETLGTILPPLVLLGISLWLGISTPSVLRTAWTEAVAQLFPTP